MKECTIYIAMVLVQLAYGGSNILVKISLEKGLDQLAFVVYRHLIGMLLLGPFAYAFERKQWRSLTISVIAKIFVLAALGTTIHLNVFYAGLSYTSPMVSSALSNVSPSLTFLMALVLGMEKVKIKSVRSQSKVVGTLICVCGSLVFTFWKGGYVFKGFVDRPLINIYDPRGSVSEFKHSKENWIKGSTLILTSHIAWSAWLILQAVVSKLYPAPMSLTTLICFFASLQSSLLALFFDRKPTSWRLEWNVQLLTIVYSGVVITALLYYVQTWCISKKGPVFSAMFSPLQIIMVGIASAIAFAERLHFGSLIGALLIVVGLYCVLWGKAEDNIVVVEQSTEIETGFNDTKILKLSSENIPVVNPVVSIANQRT